MSRVGRDARLVFVGLWSLADDEGRFRADPRFVAGQILPYDADGLGTIKKALAELEREGCVQLYGANGSHYGFVTGWKAHQKIDRPSQSRLPQPPEKSLANPREESTKPREASCEEGMGMEQGGEQGMEQGVQPPMKSDGRTPFVIAPPPADKDPEMWDGMDFYRWAMGRRQASSLSAEPAPKLPKLSAWWSQARMTQSTKRIKEAFYRYGDDPFWKSKTPPWPFLGFMSQWDRFLPPGDNHATR